MYGKNVIVDIPSNKESEKLKKYKYMLLFS